MLGLDGLVVGLVVDLINNRCQFYMRRVFDLSD
jgi:hypothetical protein